jgi:hypothetical protein
MELYNDQTVAHFKLKGTNDLLRRRQGLALPILPPSTTEARQYFFQKIRVFATAANQDGKHGVDYIGFAKEWNKTTDGKTRFYITTEVLVAYAKSWKRNSNSRASQELISDQLKVVDQTRKIFSAPHLPFPSFLTSTAEAIQPPHGLLELSDNDAIPPSITTDLVVSRPSDMFEPVPPEAGFSQPLSSRVPA